MMTHRIAAGLMLFAVIGLPPSAQVNPTITIENAQHLELSFSTSFSPSNGAIAMAYSTDGTRLVLATLNQQIVMIDTQDGDIIWEKILESDPLSITFSTEDTLLLMTDSDATIRILEAETGDSVSVFNYKRLTNILNLAVHDDQIAFMANSELYITTLDDGEISDEVREIDVPQFQDGNRVLYSPDGKFLVTYGPDGFRSWETDTVNSERPHSIATMSSKTTYEVLFIPDSKQLIVSASYGIRIIDIETLQLRQIISDEPTLGITLSSDGSLLALSNFYGSVSLWDIASGKPIVYLPTKPYTFAYPVAFNHDDSVLVFSTSEARVEFYSLGELDTDDFMDRAEDLSVIGEYLGAVLDYRRVLEVEPDNEDALLGRGRAYFKLGEYRDAIRDFDTLLEIDDKNAEAYAFRGRTHYHAGEYLAAIEDINQAIEFEFYDPAWAYLIRGLAYRGLGDYGTALADLTTAIAINPDYEPAYTNRAFIYSHYFGDWEKALEDDRKALEINPDYTNYNGVAWDLVQLGEFEEALDMVNESLDLYVTPEALDTRGWAYMGLKEYDLAIEDFEAAIEQGEVYSYYGLGKVYWELGDNELALENLETYEDFYGSSTEDEALEIITMIENGETFSELEDGKVEEPAP